MSGPLSLPASFARPSTLQLPPSALPQIPSPAFRGLMFAFFFELAAGSALFFLIRILWRLISHQ
jgi:hypothetical protein